ncbi:hypothetical protein [Photobacterium galatheae]|uniref:Uncharacterized protein n=1 Tax=Photobacterium galatheae TaxID=1654360 RepID=A0A066RSF3_9GAMM|nr:hypothetical protein [Photobacterium galatheae]KDM90323.1 hypothetical protein EA58_17660 [Photobacterium galatheae]MCM0150796.1 hypothetical protein [Photobacterium galatheae]
MRQAGLHHIESSPQRAQAQGFQREKSQGAHAQGIQSHGGKVSLSRLFQLIIGGGLMVLGAYVLMLLALNLNDYIQDFPGSPVHQYLIDSQEQGFFLAFGNNDIRVSQSFMNVIALFFSFYILKIWVSVGKTLVQTGKFLLEDKKDQA